MCRCVHEKEGSQPFSCTVVSFETSATKTCPNSATEWGQDRFPGGQCRREKVCFTGLPAAPPKIKDISVDDCSGKIHFTSVRLWLWHLHLLIQTAAVDWKIGGQTVHTGVSDWNVRFCRPGVALTVRSVRSLRS